MRYLLFIVMVLFFLSCNDDKSASTEITADNPAFLASLAYQIANSRGNEGELVSIFKRHGYSLLEGSEAFNKAYQEVISDEEKNKIYQQKLFDYMQGSLGLDKSLDKSELGDNSLDKNELSDKDAVNKLPKGEEN